MVGVMNATEAVTSAYGNVSSLVSDSVYQAIKPFSGIIQAIGIVVLIYLIILIIKGILSIRNSLNLKKITNNVEQINEKLDKLIGKRKR